MSGYRIKHKLPGGRVVSSAVPFTDDNGNQHPAEVLRRWTPEELAGIGVLTIEEELFDSKNFKAEMAVVEKDGKRTYKVKKLTPKKNIDDIKAQYIEAVKVHASSLLASSDWKVLRALELKEPIESKLATYRQAIRADSNHIEGLINAITDYEELLAFDIHNDENGDSRWSEEV